jgi:hypothetical protein
MVVSKITWEVLFGSHIFQILKSWSLDFSKNQFHFPYFFAFQNGLGELAWLIIKYNLVYNLCFEIIYLYPHVFFKFSIYFLVIYRLIFKWFSHKITVFFLICTTLHDIFFSLILFNWFHVCLFYNYLINKKIILINKIIKHNMSNDL